MWKGTRTLHTNREEVSIYFFFGREGLKCAHLGNLMDGLGASAAMVFEALPSKNITLKVPLLEELTNSLITCVL